MGLVDRIYGGITGEGNAIVWRQQCKEGVTDYLKGLGESVREAYNFGEGATLMSFVMVMLILDSVGKLDSWCLPPRQC